MGIVIVRNGEIVHELSRRRDTFLNFLPFGEFAATILLIIEVKFFQ